VVVLYLGFGLACVLFWAYFRFRPTRWAPHLRPGDEEQEAIMR
jgi:hypothetical protein